MSITQSQISPDAVERARLTRDAILDCAEKVFAERGYRATNLTHVASQLGATRQALYYHYPRKHDILLALFRRFMDALWAGVDGIMAERPPPEEVFGLLLEHHARVVAGKMDLVTILMCETPEFPAESLPLMTEQRRAYNDWLITAYEEGVQAGALRDVDAKLAVDLLLGAINCMFRWYRPGGPLGPEEIARFTASLLRDGFGLSELAPVIDLKDPEIWRSRST